MLTLDTTTLTGDIPESLFEDAQSEALVGWDIETTGLNWRVDKIATCQLAIGNRLFVVRLDGAHAPSRLSNLLSDGGVKKIFHHAPFDVRFMSYRWDVTASNVACTKIAAKITHPGLPDASYSLKSLLQSQLMIEIDKSERFSDWQAPHLSERQIEYAASDVAYLPQLLETLEAKGRRQGRWGLVEDSFQYVPTRAQLDILEVGDVFVY